MPTMTRPGSLRWSFLSALTLGVVACGSSGSANSGIDGSTGPDGAVEHDAAGMDAPEVEGSTTCPARASVVPGAACAVEPSVSCPTDHPHTCCGMTGTGSGFDVSCTCMGGVWSSCDDDPCTIVCAFDAGTNDAGDSGPGDSAPPDSGASDASITDASGDL
jgi:hypothetical protein